MTFLVEIPQGWYRLRILSTCCWKARGRMADTETITLSIVSAIFVWVWWKTVKSILCTPSDSINENQEELAARKKELVEENAWGTGDHEEGGGALVEVEEEAAGKGVGSQFLQTNCFGNNITLLRKQYNMYPQLWIDFKDSFMLVENASRHHN